MRQLPINCVYIFFPFYIFSILFFSCVLYAVFIVGFLLRLCFVSFFSVWNLNLLHICRFFRFYFKILYFFSLSLCTHINRQKNDMHGKYTKWTRLLLGTILIELNRFMNETTDTKPNEGSKKQNKNNNKNKIIEVFKAWHMIKQIKDTRKPNSKWYEI